MQFRYRAQIFVRVHSYDFHTIVGSYSVGHIPQYFEFKAASLHANKSKALEACNPARLQDCKTSIMQARIHPSSPSPIRQALCSIAGVSSLVSESCSTPHGCSLPLSMIRASQPGDQAGCLLVPAWGLRCSLGAEIQHSREHTIFR